MCACVTHTHEHDTQKHENFVCAHEITHEKHEIFVCAHNFTHETRKFRVLDFLKKCQNTLKNELK